MKPGMTFVGKTPTSVVARRHWASWELMLRRTVRFGTCCACSTSRSPREPVPAMTNSSSGRVAAAMSAIGGVPEATPDDRFLVAPGTSAAGWLARIEEVLANRAERGAVATAYAGKFTSARSAQRLIDLATLAADRLDRQSPLKLDPLDEYLTTWPARLPVVTEAVTGAAEPA